MTSELPMATPGVEPEGVKEAEATSPIEILVEGALGSLRITNLLARCVRNRHITLISVQITQILNPKEQSYWNVGYVRIALEQSMKVDANLKVRATYVVESTWLIYARMQSQIQPHD